MKQNVLRGIVGVILVFAGIAPASEITAKITMIEGDARFLRSGGEKWRAVRPGLPLQVGDQVYTQPESFLEIRYTIGAILRLDESTKITIEQSSEKASRTRTGMGEVWVNMQKIIGSGRDFEVASPTATAAIRGTVFHMSTDEDSTSAVSVYNGKVAVGPSSSAQSNSGKSQPKMQEPTEIPGPQEVPGPYEVPLETWTTIVAGQRISVRKDGTFASESFDVDEKSDESFVARNKKIDKKLAEENGEND